MEVDVNRNSDHSVRASLYGKQTREIILEEGKEEF